MTLTMTDLFCGAGGSSTGAVDADELLAALRNLWPTLSAAGRQTAIETAAIIEAES